MKFAFRFFFFLSLLSTVNCTKDAQDRIYTGILEGKVIQIPAFTGGKISQMLIEEGQYATQGDTLAVIDTTELALEHEQLKATLEEIEIQKQILQTKENQAKVDRDYAEQEYERIKTLYDENVTPKQNLDHLNNQLQQAYSAFEIAHQQTESISARQKQVHAQLALLQKKVSDAVITAPINGMISSRYYEMGEAIPPLQPLFELIRNDLLEVKIYIPENQLAIVSTGQEVRIRVDGLENELSGHIKWISPKAEFTPKMILTPDTRTSLVYAVTISVTNINSVLKHGMPVEVVFTQ
ncbi:HlyD family efflux transporter periplasmic adaptor subunit [bacterium]|nr:HlyD family efflux transporter periplasmic adaptor subunit [bacterium]